MERRIAILVSDGFTDSGLSVALDVFRVANALARGAGHERPFALEVVSARGGQVRAASGMVLRATARPAAAARADVVLVPGWWVEEAVEMDAVLERKEVRVLVDLRCCRPLARSHGRVFVWRGVRLGGGRSPRRAAGHDGVVAGLHLQRRHPQIDLQPD